MIYYTLLLLAVTEIPSNFRATNFQYTSANLTWEPVLGAAGYEVFYYRYGSQDPHMSAGNTTDTKLVVGPFNLTTSHSFFVVAFQDGPYMYTLPSGPSNEDSIEFGKFVSASSRIIFLKRFPSVTDFTISGNNATWSGYTLSTNYLQCVPNMSSAV